VAIVSISSFHSHTFPCISYKPKPFGFFAGRCGGCQGGNGDRLAAGGALALFAGQFIFDPELLVAMPAGE